MGVEDCVGGGSGNDGGQGENMAQPQTSSSCTL